MWWPSRSLELDVWKTKSAISKLVLTNRLRNAPHPLRGIFYVRLAQTIVIRALFRNLNNLFPQPAMHCIAMRTIMPHQHHVNGVELNRDFK